MSRSRIRRMSFVLLAAAVALGAPGSAHAQDPDFELLQVREVGTVHFNAAPEAVFALLTPAGQRSLARTWDITILSPSSGAAEPGATFTKTHRHAPVQQVWTVVTAEPPRRLSYAIFVAGLEAWVFEMELASDDDGTTSVTVRHTITSLSREANAAVREFSDTFDTYLASWNASIQRGLAGSVR